MEPKNYRTITYQCLSCKIVRDKDHPGFFIVSPCEYDQFLELADLIEWRDMLNQLIADAEAEKNVRSK